MEQGEVNALKALLKHCKDKNNSKHELNGVLVSGNKLVCTDTRQLLALDFESKFTDIFMKGQKMIEQIYLEHTGGRERLRALRSYWVRNFYSLDDSLKEALKIAILQTREEIS